MGSDERSEGRSLSRRRHLADTHSRPTQQQEETNIQEHHDKNKSGTPRATSIRHRERDSLLIRILRRLRRLRWQRALHVHEARLRWIARKRQSRRPPPLPAALKIAWLQHVDQEHPRWQPGREGWRLAAHALIQFFDASAAAAPHPCALPSRAADLVWHVWLQIDPDGLAAWQRAHYGREIPHREHAPGEDTGEALARCLVRACRVEQRGPVRGALPLLFRVDGLLRTPEGWAYARRADAAIHHRDLDPLGRPHPGSWRHDELRPAMLLGFGLIGVTEAGDLRRRAQDRQDSGSGSSCGSGSGDGGCPGGDGGDGGCGSSCGSSCGSGCGS